MPLRYKMHGGLTLLLILGMAEGYQHLKMDRRRCHIRLCGSQPPNCAPGVSAGSGLPLQAAAVPDRALEATMQMPQASEWVHSVARLIVTAIAFASVLGGSMRSASAENELAALAAEKSTAELVNPRCFATSCKTEVEACAAEGDCLKGLTCSAKCMGDAQCTMGCFARYGNPVLDRVLQCTIEDQGCIQIATQAPGGDSPYDAPLAPKALVKATPASMSGKWYKVLGFNPNYDCFECQKNTFASGADAARPLGSEVALEIGPSTAAVEVEYTMPRERLGMAPDTFHAQLLEKLEFDDKIPGSRRTAHTEGRMFGLTFWENWYLIGQNQPKEPEFRFVYYTGKTLQNRYEGAFVYARKPELPSAAMPSIYKVAREAGLDPTRACCIDNSCFAAPSGATATPPPFTPIASADVLSGVGPLTPMKAAEPTGFLGSLRQSVLDVAEMLEDPRPAGESLFARQKPMSEVREYDMNGFRKPSASYAKDIR